jgi:hypothetical protein
MTLYSSITLDSDPAKRISFGVGLLCDIVDTLSPEEQERQRRANVTEERRVEAEAEAAAERRTEVEWELARQGLVPRTPLEAAAEAHTAQDRADRRAEAAELRQASEEGGARLTGSGVDVVAPSPWAAQKAALAAKVDATKHEPASKHELGRLATAVEGLKVKVTGKRPMTNAEVIAARLAELSPDDAEAYKPRSRAPGVYW